eukprot:CAMPEP_0184699668 /NCGR_PEP_ID=MMETSP0313-20130426/5855_1 /TAXON_ID=2792 /ORGANISM="Porphyridium aerugineum, Strain SAG 1380-2" /LENGTH=351 /DNA_ID=CAMNT_0027158787 /DNA_START=279 /DNA_END=1334 /DNA_ORIENTATION=-
MATEQAQPDVVTSEEEDHHGEYMTQGATQDKTSTISRLAYVLCKKGPSGYSSAATSTDVLEHWDGRNKVVIVTGATSDIGKECVRAMAAKGAEVIMACRNVNKGEQAMKEILSRDPVAKLTVEELDLSSLASVRRFTLRFLGRQKPLHIVILNAVVMMCPYLKSQDGHELQFATNYLGHFFLTKLLLPRIIDTAKKSNNPGRIISVSSSMHFYSYNTVEGPVRFSDIDSREGYDANWAYGQSKLCNILFARELQRRMPSDQVIATSVDPGTILTDLQRTNLGSKMLMYMGFMFFKNVKQSAATICYCATAEEVMGGEYYADCNIQPSSRWSHNALLGKKLWEYSEKLVVGR